ncbi:unnamed protein product, partial [Hymenolepis diminuta]
METPSWIKRFNSVLDVLVSEEQVDDLEDPSLYERIEAAFRQNFEVNKVKNQWKKDRKIPLSHDNNNIS